MDIKKSSTDLLSLCGLAGLPLQMLSNASEPDIK